MVAEPAQVASFGEDESGEIYLLAFDGRLYELEEIPKPASKN